MSLYDNASLVMIPSGYKDDKLFSIKPTDGSGDFTFSRDGAGASPATRVNASGLIEKGRENVLLQSNQFDTTWNLVGVTATGGQAGYDGTNDAWQITKDVGVFRQIYQTISYSGVYTFSFYAKGTTAIRWRGGNNDYLYQFDLSTGTATSHGVYNAIEIGMVSVGGGWYRCYGTANFSARASYEIYADWGDPTILSFYLQDAQLEQGLIATDVIETTTAPVSAGLLGDMPRLDYHNPDSPTPNSCPNLLLEPSRVNLVANSEYFPTFFSGLSVTQNATTSPEGVTNATKAVELSGTNGKAINLDSVSYTSGTTYTHSFFAKSSNRYIQMYFSNSLFTTDHANFDLVNGVVGGKSNDVTSSIEDYGNGWYRCTTTITAPATGSVSNLLLLVDDVNATRGQAYTGDGSSFVEVYGMQVEAGSYPTSYIPTYGSASTRGKDVCIDAGNSSTFNDSEGVLYAEISALANDLSNRLISLTNGTSTERISLFYSQDSSNEVKGIVFAGGVVTGEVEYNVPDITANIKVALKYKANDFALWINGVEVATDLSGAVPSGLDRLNFDLGISGSILPFFGNVKQTIYFPTALTDAELAALTA